MFLADRTHNLITRLHQNVIRTGLRRINLAYSRISLAEIATKLHLASAEDAGGWLLRTSVCGEGGGNGGAGSAPEIAGFRPWGREAIG